jgi:hypothetical protein
LLSRFRSHPPSCRPSRARRDYTMYIQGKLQRVGVMKRTPLLLCCSIFVVTILCFLFFQKNEFLNKKSYAKELLGNLTGEERDLLSHACRELFYDSPMGYTLFGDKPMSEVCIVARPGDARRHFFLKLELPLIHRYESYLNTSNFVLVLESDSKNPCLYLVNKKAFLHAVEQNIELFRQVLGPDVTPTSLLNTISNKMCSIHSALAESHLLFGILFGLGVENALHFERRYQIEQIRYGQGVPPWKDPNGEKEMNMEGVFSFNLQRQACLKASEQEWSIEKNTPSAGFSTVEDELYDLNNKLSFCDGGESPPRILSSVGLPEFVADPSSDETKKLIEKYTIQRGGLMKILAGEDFLERVMEKFYESC